MTAISGVLAASSDVASVSLGFRPAHLMVALSSGGPCYVSLTSSAATTATGICLFSTSVDPVILSASLNYAPNPGTTMRITEFGPYFSAISSSGVSGGVRYWAMSF